MKFLILLALVSGPILAKDKKKSGKSVEKPLTKKEVKELRKKAKKVCEAKEKKCEEDFFKKNLGQCKERMKKCEKAYRAKYKLPQ